MLGSTVRGASSSTTDVQLLTLELLQKLQHDVAELRTTLSNVDLTTTNNARRLEAMDKLLQRSKPEPVPATPNSLDCLPPAAIIGAAAALSILLHSRKTRRLLQQTVRQFPLSLILLAQASAGGCLLAYRGLDSLRTHLGLSGSADTQQTHEKRKFLAHLLLLISTAALPSKALAVEGTVAISALALVAQ